MLMIFLCMLLCMVISSPMKFTAKWKLVHDINKTSFIAICVLLLIIFDFFFFLYYSRTTPRECMKISLGIREILYSYRRLFRYLYSRTNTNSYSKKVEYFPWLFTSDICSRSIFFFLFYILAHIYFSNFSLRIAKFTNFFSCKVRKAFQQLQKLPVYVYNGTK